MYTVERTTPPRIPKIYNITAIWSAHKKLLTVKPIATLREDMKWKTTAGEMKDINDESHISKKPSYLYSRLVLSCLLFDKIWYDMALCTIISWETSPPLAFGPRQERSFQLGVENLLAIFENFTPSHCSGQIISSYLAKPSSFPQSMLAPLPFQ